MRIVTILAVGGGHFSRVRLVALGALRYLPVDVMTPGTAEGRMFAHVILEKPGFRPVADLTGVVACALQ